MLLTYLCSQTQGNLQGQEISLALNSYLCGPEHINQKLKSRDVCCLLVPGSVHSLVWQAVPQQRSPGCNISSSRLKCLTAGSARQSV